MIRAIISLFKKRYIYRSAVTGKFVSRSFAEANPSTTVRIRV